MNSSFNMLEKARELHKNSKRDCKNFIANNINYFYKELSLEQFLEIINMYKDCFKDRESNISDILKTKNIPYILIDLNSTKKDDILNLAKKYYNNKQLIDALEYIKLLEQKFDVDMYIYTLKGNILKDLKNYNAAINSYQSAKNLKTFDLLSNIKIIETYILKYKKELAIFSSIIVFILIFQFVFFKTGIVSPNFYEFAVKIDNENTIIENENTIVIKKGTTSNVNIDYKFRPSYAKEGNVNYEIDDKNIAVVDKNNDLTGIIEGNTKLNVIRNNHILHTYDVIVANPIVEKLELSMDKNLSQVGDMGKLDVKVTRNHDFNIENNINYESSDEKVIKVDEEGFVEVVGCGKAKVIVECEELISEQEFNINLVVEDLILDYDVEIEVGDEYILNVDLITNSTEENKPRVMFSLENEKDYKPIITIDSNGKIKGLKEGTQIVNVKCLDIEKSVMVTVKPKDITKQKVSKVDYTSQIINKHLNINLNWDELNSDYQYEIYSKFKGEQNYKHITTTQLNNCTIQYDLTNYNSDGYVDIYIIAKNDKGTSMPSDILNINFNNE